jgi:DNA-binding NtrC family response regulator
MSSRLPAYPRQPGILIAADVSLGNFLVAVLREHDIRAWLACSGNEAVAIYQLRKKAIDLVLLDVCRLGTDAPRTLTMLREINPRIAAWLMAGAGASPFKLSKLLGALRRAAS